MNFFGLRIIPVNMISRKNRADAVPAESGRFLAGLCLVVGQDVGGVHPLGVIVEEGALLVQAVGAGPVVLHLSVLYGLHLPEEQSNKQG